MNTNLISFDYNNNVVRTQVTENGEPLVCLADICNVLDLANPTHAANAIKEEFGIPTLNVGMVIRPDGSSIEATFITEPQLYFVLYRSRSDKAKPFRRWVDSEVLPSIRKTGSYSIKTKKEVLSVEQKFIAAKIMLEPAGIKGNQLTLALDNIYRANVGESLLAQTGVQLEAPQPKQLCTPTQIGKPLGWSAIKVNKELEARGLQYKTEAGWEPTEEGVAQGAIMLDTGKRHSSGVPVRQLKWPMDILG